MAANESGAVALRPVERAEVEVVEDRSLLPSSSELATIQLIAALAAKSGYWDGNTPEKAAMQILAGREYGLGPWQALSGMHIIKGKPSLAADTMSALVLRYLKHAGGGEFRVTESTAQSCTVRYRRPEWEDAGSVTWTIEEARTAQLVVNGGNWVKYPRAMLRARAISEAARAGFSDICAGLYDPDELEHTQLRPVTPYDARPPATIRKTPQVAGRGQPVEGRLNAAGTTPPPKSEHQQAMDELHAVGADRGYQHESLHLLGWTIGVTSLTQLSAAQLRDLAAWVRDEPDEKIREVMNDGLGMKQAAEGAPPDDGPPPEMESETADWLAMIRDARNPGELESVGRQMKDAGVNANALRDAYRARQADLARMGG